MSSVQKPSHLAESVVLELLNHCHCADTVLFFVLEPYVIDVSHPGWLPQLQPLPSLFS